MGSVELQPHELPALLNLLKTYILNTATTGMTPNPHNGLRRHLAPATMPLKNGTRDPLDIQERSQLAWSWECTLFQLPDAYLYDGTTTSAKAFEDTTGLTPHRFAQAWCETFECAWWFFYPAKPGKAGKQEVLEGLRGYWAAKTKYWRTAPGGTVAVKKDLLTKCGQQLFDQITILIERALPEVMSVGGKKKESVDIVKQLQIVAQPDCEAHPWMSVCSCAIALDMPVKYERNLTGNFIQAWETRLVRCDDTFLHDGGVSSSTLSKGRMPGQTPAHFADACATDMDAIPFWKVRHKLALITAMLAYWAHKTRSWRSTCKIRRESFKEQGNAMIVEKATGISRRIDPHKNDNDDDPRCPYVKVESKGPGHEHTVVLYAKWEKDQKGEFGYDIVRMTPCHEACEFLKGAMADLGTLTKAFQVGDMARAKAVKAEW